VSFDGWVALERAAVVRLFAAAREPGDGRRGLSDVRAALRAFSLPADDVEALNTQQDVLARCLRGLPLGELNVNAVVNYTLGSGDAATDLDLRAASELATALASLSGRDLAVGTAAAVVETCGAARSWRLDESRLAPLRLSLALGLRAPVSAPQVKFRARTAEVLVVAPCRLDGGPFADDLRAALLDGGAGDVAVISVSLGGQEAGRRLAALVARRRPLAVVLVPLAGGSEGAPAAAELTAMAGALETWRQPALVVQIAGAMAAPLDDAVIESGLPVVEIDGVAATPTSDAARLAAAALSRACWPDYLAPRLPGTRLEFSFAARRAATVAVAAAPGDGSARWLTSCGYTVDEDAAAGWDAPAGPAVVYPPGGRRAAFALAGDLGWALSTVHAAPAAPAELAVVTAIE